MGWDSWVAGHPTSATRQLCRLAPLPHCSAGRGAVFDSGLTVAQGGCVEPRYCPSLETKLR